RGLELSGISVSVPPTVSVGANGDAVFNVTASIDGSIVTTGDPLQLQWYIRATPAEGGPSLSMPFYLRAIRIMPSAASLNAIGDDATPDREDGIDRDGRFTVSWTYPATETARPCGYRVEETRPTASGTMWMDAGDELMLNAGNTIWDATDWTTRPHPNTLSTGYAPIYIDNATASMTTKNEIQLPPALIHLSFDSFEDFELDFDYGYVDVSADHGASWDNIARYTGAFSGTRELNLSAYAGKAVKVRFRITSDGGVSMPAYQGWYVDDIRLQAGSSFNPIATVPSSTTSLAIGGKQDGTYAYRVVALFDNCAMNPFATTPSDIEEVAVQIATHPPMAAFSSSTNPSQTAQSVTFDASASADQDQVGGTPGIASYNWSFGDGATATGSVANHVYASPGTYRVSLTVVDEEGESANTEQLQTVHDPDSAVNGGGNVGAADFGVDAGTLSGATNGSMTWNDIAAHRQIESTRISRIDRNGNRATIYGDCTVNKGQTFPCVMEVVDNGTSGDTASIQVGGYTKSGTVSNGDVSVW
ncbi:MAG TPA: PKD domain-containing protein, partial [Thermoanaerobaculia bacterium]|nr:PKD domain-containing protein [Thermoanaerobaculia bacterium]